MDRRTASLEWDPTLELGHEALDGQHRELMALAERVCEACLQSDRGTLLHELRRLTEFAAAHFLYEESWMKRSGYPNARRHARHHRNILASLDRFAGDVLAGRLSRRGSRISAFLRSWVALEITSLDRELADHLARHAACGPASSPGAVAG